MTTEEIHFALIRELRDRFNSRLSAVKQSIKENMKEQEAVMAEGALLSGARASDLDRLRTQAENEAMDAMDQLERLLTEEEESAWNAAIEAEMHSRNPQVVDMAAKKKGEGKPKVSPAKQADVMSEAEDVQKWMDNAMASADARIQAIMVDLDDEGITEEMTRQLHDELLERMRIRDDLETIPLRVPGCF